MKSYSLNEIREKLQLGPLPELQVDEEEVSHHPAIDRLMADIERRKSGAVGVDQPRGSPGKDNGQVVRRRDR